MHTGGTGVHILRWLKKNLSASGKPCRGARLTNCGAKGASEVNAYESRTACGHNSHARLNNKSYRIVENYKIKSHLINPVS